MFFGSTKWRWNFELYSGRPWYSFAVIMMRFYFIFGYLVGYLRNQRELRWKINEYQRIICVKIIVGLFQFVILAMDCEHDMSSCCIDSEGDTILWSHLVCLCFTYLFFSPSNRITENHYNTKFRCISIICISIPKKLPKWNFFSNGAGQSNKISFIPSDFSRLNLFGRRALFISAIPPLAYH